MTNFQQPNWLHELTKKKEYKELKSEVYYENEEVLSGIDDEGRNFHIYFLKKSGIYQIRFEECQ